MQFYRFFPLFAALALTGCMAAPAGGPAARANADLQAPPGLASFDVGATLAPSARLPGNTELARDFLELTFQLESGRTLPRFTRFQEPITLTLAGAVPPNAGQEIAGLLAMLRSGAGIDIRQQGPGPAAIVVEFLPRREMQALVPNAACFVVPGVSSWQAYRAARGSTATDWAMLAGRSQVAVFLPSDVAPQEMRDCLHEEIAQALGPLNDLYRLTDSVFNDDNFVAVLSPRDLLMLRLTYAPELRNGMSEAEVAAALPAALARINPAGGSIATPAPATPTPRAFQAALDAALSSSAAPTRRLIAAQSAVEIATGEGWHDARAGFAWFALGRLSASTDPARARRALLQADAIYRALPGAAIHQAHVRMQLAALALSSQQPGEALLLADSALNAAIAAENPALVATLHLIRAEAYAALGNTAAAAAARLDSARWAGYGFGSQAAADRRAAEVAALATGTRHN
ncbi:DUF2927 domain-containing protein [Phaeovulum sp.]|uniref:DUF2927 domain-containing protein n=1 Tax=Phaeovulum sp. TaxID=2934796 RepID=UPI00356A821B